MPVEKKSKYTIAIDSREKKPYTFKGYNSKIVTLKTGDYSIIGMENILSIERKSKQDAYQSLGQGRARFRKELIRLSELKYAAIVIESTMKDFMVKPQYTRMNPKSVVNSILAWSVRYNVCVFFADDRIYGEAIVRQLLDKFFKYNENVV